MYSCILVTMVTRWGSNSQIFVASLPDEKRGGHMNENGSVLNDHVGADGGRSFWTVHSGRPTELHRRMTREMTGGQRRYITMKTTHAAISGITIRRPHIRPVAQRTNPTNQSSRPFRVLSFSPSDVLTRAVYSNSVLPVPLVNHENHRNVPVIRKRACTRTQMT